ncbi:hypothetical protein CYMTET_54187 [Cymbomonas tetramitiformis]|uniref:Uncharacterized protein n=1 Tax=Cymbomonas tetramitiformis TaxID=36881 RepID=A0AAE0EPB4_9CHLO|nr:hypothetical protein CYMTET_54187 [Cymbomonas tetramitiformis]
MRSTSWEKQRGQILSWVRSSLAILQLLPEEWGCGRLLPVPGLLGKVRNLTNFTRCGWCGYGRAQLRLRAWLERSERPGGGVSAGTARAAGTPGIGTAAAVATAPAAAVSPDVIAATIASASGAKLDDLGARLTSLEARGSAPAGVTLVSGGTVPVEAELLAQALRDCVAAAEDSDMARYAQACADLVHEAAKLRPQLTLLKSTHPFGKLPMKTLEVNAFPPMVYALPELAEEECELDELPVGKEATVEHWRAFVHLLQAQVAEFQRFVKSKVPSFPLTDVMQYTFFKKRKRVTFEGDEEEARAAGGGCGLLPPLGAARREHLATLGSSFKTVNEEQLARALRGELAPEDVVRPLGAGPPQTAMPSQG